MVISPFGDLLKTLRQHAHISQRALAEKLGVHRNTIWSWEQGNYLPDSKSMVLELTRLLRLNEPETRQLLEASLTALSPHWSVPSRRNPFFTGREAFLDLVHQVLSPDQKPVEAVAQVYALQGLGGIGKTQLALEYAYRYALEYSAVFWIEAETHESIVASMIRLAEFLQLPERSETDQQRIVVAVQYWLNTHSTWLLIWDNAEDPDLLQQYLPSTRHGAILITTRLQALGALAQGIELAPLTPEEGVIFVLRRAKMRKEEVGSVATTSPSQSFSAEEQAAVELVKVMGGLPLALDQAGAYIDETGCNVSDYLQRYTDQCTQFLHRRGTPGQDHPLAVAATFSLVYEQVKQKNPCAADLLRLCAFLCAEDIPEELFIAQGSHSTHPVTDSPYQLDLAIATLRTFSLIQRHPETRTLSLHRLVQTVLQEEMSKQERILCQQRVIGLLDALFPEVTRATWEQCERLLPHVLLCEAALPDQAAANQSLANVLQRAADYLSLRARYQLAEALYQRAIRIQKQSFGLLHATVAASLDGLARLRQAQGKYKQAESFYQQSLDIREQIWGSEHLQLTRSLNSLATLYLTQANYPQAERLHQRALHILEQALGLEHPDLAHPLNDLANLYSEQGKYEQAERCYERALRIWENVFEPEHHDLAYPLCNLADLYREQRKDEQAERFYQRALRIWEQALGSEHPLVAYPLDGLAALCAHQGKDEQAEHFFQRAFGIRERALGPAHPGLAMSLDGMASLASRRQKDEQAEQLYQQALHLREQALGADHPDLAFSLNGLASLYSKQKKYAQAETLCQRALSIQEQKLGLEHPRTATTLNNLASIYYEQGKYERAELLCQQTPAK